MATDTALRGVRASHNVSMVIDGTLDYRQLSAAETSWFSFYIFNKAISIIKLENKLQRINALAEIKEPLRGMVKKEVIKYWK